MTSVRYMYVDVNILGIIMISQSLFCYICICSFTFASAQFNQGDNLISINESEPENKLVGDFKFLRAINISDVENYNASNVIRSDLLGNENFANSISSHIRLPCNGETCVRKCCPTGRYRARGFCQPLEEGMKDWIPETPNAFLLYGVPQNKTPDEYCVSHGLSEVDLQPNGDLILKNRKLVFAVDAYCFDNFLIGNTETQVRVGLCYEPILLTDFEKNVVLATSVTNGISCGFILPLIVAHVVYPQIRSKMHEKCFLSMCVALFFGILSRLFIQLEITKYYSVLVCVTLGILTQYFNLSFNFWLHIRCYETLRIVRGTVKAIPMAELDSSNKRLVKYSLICWGAPFLISTLTLIMQVLPVGLIPNIHPQIANGRCWMKETFLIQAVYYFMYQVLMHILNVFYMGTSFYLLYNTGEMKCCSIKKKGDDTMRSYNRKSLNMFWQQFNIFLLFVVILSLDSLSLTNTRATFWRYVDIINSLQGVILFLIFLLGNESRRKALVNAYRSTSSSLGDTISTSISIPIRGWMSSTTAGFDG